MFRRTLAAILTDQNATSGDSSIFVAYDVETEEDDAVDSAASPRQEKRATSHPPSALPLTSDVD